ncbi:MAG: hypothetical protein DME97_04180 [Verrucomicrobia bacterium]|nr:MAG: hypothetical protein DME97_04180 [Verrucomicrobiota bacterium]
MERTPKAFGVAHLILVRVATRFVTTTNYIAALLACAACCVFAAADVRLARLTTTTGGTFTDVVVTAADSSGVRIIHKTGAATLPWSEIPDQLRATLGYSAAAVPAAALSAAPPSAPAAPLEAARKHSAQSNFPIIGASEQDVTDKFKLYPRVEAYDCPSGLSCFAVTTEGPGLEFRFLRGTCVYYQLSGIKETEDAFAILKKYGDGAEWQKVSEQNGGDMFSWGYHTTSVFRRSDTGLVATLHMGIPRHHASNTTLDVTFEAPAYTAHLRKLKDAHDRSKDRAAEERIKDF